MRLALLVTLALGTTAFAQHRTGAPPPAFHGGPRIGARRTFVGGPVYVPYPAYGAGFDGFYATDYPVPYGPGPANYDPAYNGYDPAGAYPPAPTVVINQNFQTESVRPQLRDYSNTPLPEPGAVMTPPSATAAPPPSPQLADDQPTIFLIAMQDHTILPVIAYWVQGDTLHYISLKGDPNQVSVALVDRDFSKQLNADRHVPFALPPAR